MLVILFAYSINKHFEIVIVLCRVTRANILTIIFDAGKVGAFCIFIAVYATEVWLRVS